MAKQARSRNLALYTEEEVEARLPVLLAGIKQYNAGYYFESHETWEELWLRSPWPFRQFLQGLIQMAAAFVHLMRHEYPGTIRLLDEAIAKLENPSMTLGVDAKGALAGARRARHELAALGPERFEEWDTSRITRIRMLGSGQS